VIYHSHRKEVAKLSKPNESVDTTYCITLPLFGAYTINHDSSVGEWMCLTVCPLRGPGLIRGHDGVFREIIPGLSHVLPCARVWEYQWAMARTTAQIVVKIGVASL